MSEIPSASNGHGFSTGREVDFLSDVMIRTNSIEAVVETAAAQKETLSEEFVKQQTIIPFGYVIDKQGRWSSNGRVLEELSDPDEEGGDRIGRVITAEQRMAQDSQIRDAVVISEDLGFGRHYIYVYKARGDEVQAIAVEYQGTEQELARLQSTLSETSVQQTDGDFTVPLFFTESLAMPDVLEAIYESYESDASRQHAASYLMRVSRDVGAFPLVIEAHNRRVQELAGRYMEQMLENQNVVEGIRAIVNAAYVELQDEIAASRDSRIIQPDSHKRHDAIPSIDVVRQMPVEDNEQGAQSRVHTYQAGYRDTGEQKSSVLRPHSESAHTRTIVQRDVSSDQYERVAAHIHHEHSVSRHAQAVSSGESAREGSEQLPSYSTDRKDSEPMTTGQQYAVWDSVAFIWTVENVGQIWMESQKLDSAYRPPRNGSEGDMGDDAIGFRLDSEVEPWQRFDEDELLWIDEYASVVAASFLHVYGSEDDVDAEPLELVATQESEQGGELLVEIGESEELLMVVVQMSSAFSHGLGESLHEHEGFKAPERKGLGSVDYADVILALFYRHIATFEHGNLDSEKFQSEEKSSDNVLQEIDDRSEADRVVSGLNDLHILAFMTHWNSSPEALSGINQEKFGKNMDLLAEVSRALGIGDIVVEGELVMNDTNAVQKVIAAYSRIIFPTAYFLPEESISGEGGEVLQSKNDNGKRVLDERAPQVKTEAPFSLQNANHSARWVFAISLWMLFEHDSTERITSDGTQEEAQDTHEDGDEEKKESKVAQYDLQEKNRWLLLAIIYHLTMLAEGALPQVSSTYSDDLSDDDISQLERYGIIYSYSSLIN